MTLNTQSKLTLLAQLSFYVLTVFAVDDMFLESDIYNPAGTTFQVTTADLAQHITWAATVNSRLPSGSSWFMEVGHNGNGNIEVSIIISGPFEAFFSFFI